jgi:Outer membrane protein beta-barrel domain
MKKLYTLIAAATVITTASAQTTFGVNAGVVNSNWKGDALNSLNNVVDLSNGFITTKSKTGFTVGGYANIPVSEKIAIVPGLNYTERGYGIRGDLKIEALKFLGVNASANVESHYIDVPLTIKAEVAKGLSIYAGPQVSFLAKTNVHVKTSVLGISLYNNKLDITDNFNRVDMGITGGIGYQFNNGFNIKAAYDRGLTKLDKNDNFKAYNSALKLTVGFTF